MTRYSWMIHTAEEETDGTLGEVYLSLHGLKASTREIKLPRRDYQSGSVESGVIEVRSDLGEIQTGSLRTGESTRSRWTPDWIRIVNLADGRQWTAQGVACDADGSCSLLPFVRTRDSVEIQSSTEGNKLVSQRIPTAEQLCDPPGSESSEEDPDTGAGPVVRTYEIFGAHQGRLVPLSAILRIGGGTAQRTRGAHVFVTDQASQGFGLGGEPGRWEDLYPGVDPALYGLDSDKPILASDGTRGWVVDAHYLAMIFGADWRRVVYGN